MLVATTELPRLRSEVAMVDGGFDPLHAGHVEHFRAAAELGMPVLCNVSSDRWVERKHPVLLPQEERAALIDALRFVAYTHVSSVTTEEVLRTLEPRYYVKGADWRNRLPAGEARVCHQCGIEIVFLETVLNSSTNVLRDYERRAAAWETA